MRQVTAYLGVGANEGDREANIHSALERLGSVPGVRVLRVSTLRPSEFMGQGPAQAEFLNGVAEVATTLPAAALLAVCKQLELAAGRDLSGPPNHPRPLDLDLLLYGEEQIDSADLVVPHPRLWDRPFVVEPLRELGVDPDQLSRPETLRVVRHAEELVRCCSAWWVEGLSVGFVPTMGALHAGHESLLEMARRECDRVLASIFVNPLQFGPSEDFDAYPRDLDEDLRICEQRGVDVVFAPAVTDMYPEGFCSNVAVGDEAQTMEGAVRDGHFEGVATVVARLFALARPHRAYFGRKDAQQVAVLRRMNQDLGFPTKVVECPIVREDDGLALSSRNVYLSAEDRAASLVLYRSLTAARAAFAAGERDRDRLLAVAREVLASEPRAALDYLELRREGDLAELPPGQISSGRMLIAAKFVGGKQPVRLLDNLSLDERNEPPVGAVADLESAP
ncbi:MAG: pantoate--beta-alanine ligase [Planctomycetota bacterium]|nr:pantoate--beta-alanine ligase [Planctomycetota bacterium]